jgi:hypothetical protein
MKTPPGEWEFDDQACQQGGSTPPMNSIEARQPSEGYIKNEI